MKGMTRKELMDELKLKGGGQLSEILENLKKCDFIRKYATIGKSERDALYQLTDLYSLFYTRLWQITVGRIRTSGVTCAIREVEQPGAVMLSNRYAYIISHRSRRHWVFLVFWRMFIPGPAVLCRFYWCRMARRSDRYADRPC